MTTKEKNKRINKPAEKKLSPAEKKRVEILKSGKGLFKEEFEKGIMKPFVRK